MQEGGKKEIGIRNQEYGGIPGTYSKCFFSRLAESLGCKVRLSEKELRN
jgi:uncharacterized protein YmfQ (DUF2313 family)